MLQSNLWMEHLYMNILMTHGNLTMKMSVKLLFHLQDFFKRFPWFTWLETMDVNLTATFRFSKWRLNLSDFVFGQSVLKRKHKQTKTKKSLRHSIRKFLEQDHGGVIINMCSIQALASSYGLLCFHTKTF